MDNDWVGRSPGTRLFSETSHRWYENRVIGTDSDGIPECRWVVLDNTELSESEREVVRNSELLDLSDSAGYCGIGRQLSGPDSSVNIPASLGLRSTRIAGRNRRPSRVTRALRALTAARDRQAARNEG